MRKFTGEGISIDGNQIPWFIMDAEDYFKAKEIDIDSKVLNIIDQIMALKQAGYLFRVTSGDGATYEVLADSLFELKLELIKKLKEQFDFIFDEQFVEDYGFEDKKIKNINKEYLDNYIKNFVLDGELVTIYNKKNRDNKKVIEYFKWLMENSEKDQVIICSAIIEYIENNEELPAEYKCLKID